MQLLLVDVIELQSIIKTKLADATVTEVMQACSEQVSARPGQPGASMLYLF